MEFWSNLLNKSKSSGFVVLMIAICMYFTYFAVKGDRGILTYMYLQNKISERKLVQQTYDKQKSDLEQKVNLLDKSSLDLDLLDERARSVLNVVGKDEFIIIDEEN